MAIVVMVGNAGNHDLQPNQDVLYRLGDGSLKLHTNFLFELVNGPACYVIQLRNMLTHPLNRRRLRCTCVLKHRHVLLMQRRLVVQVLVETNDVGLQGRHAALKR